MEAFKEFLQHHRDINSERTIAAYTKHVEGYKKWFAASKGMEATRLHRENIKEFISYLRTVKQQSPKTINAKLSALQKWNDFLMAEGVQEHRVIEKNDYIKVQNLGVTPATLNKQDVEKFRQLLLDNERSKRNYAIVTVMAYGGLRISECLGIKMSDYNTTSRELVVRGKGDKIRTVYMHDKIIDAIKGWTDERQSETDYLFVSNRDKPIDRTQINKVFKRYSEKLGKEITPHDLRHFFCSNALDKGMSFHLVAQLAGHANIQTTLTYAHPTRDNLMEQINQL